MTIVITATNRLNGIINETIANVNSMEQAKSMHDTHRAIFSDCDVETFSSIGQLFNDISISAKEECKKSQLVTVDKRNVTVKEESNAYWKWFHVSLN